MIGEAARARGLCYQGILLDARNLGAEELRAQSDPDPVVRDYVRHHDAPDFLLVASRTDLDYLVNVTSLGHGR